MITFRKITTRPGLDVEFLPETPEYHSILDQFVAEGKILEKNITLSEDQLTQTTLLTFLDDETFLMYRHHPNIVSWISQRKKYDFENSISTEIDFL